MTAFGGATQQSCKIANFTIASYKKKEWSFPISALIVDTIMGLQPRQGAEQIRKLVENQGLQPADPNFDKPGKIDVLLGADVIPFILSKDGANNAVIAKETVFGHVFLGTYDTIPDAIPVVSSIQVVTARVEAKQIKD